MIVGILDGCSKEGLSAPARRCRDERQINKPLCEAEDENKGSQMRRTGMVNGDSRTEEERGRAVWAAAISTGCVRSMFSETVLGVNKESFVFVTTS